MRRHQVFNVYDDAACKRLQNTRNRFNVRFQMKTLISDFFLIVAAAAVAFAVLSEPCANLLIVEFNFDKLRKMFNRIVFWFSLCFWNCANLLRSSQFTVGYEQEKIS